MPVCARCEGIIIGFFAAVICLFFGRPKTRILFLMTVPLIADGTVQKTTKYTSNNRRRLVTGILFGYAFTTLVLLGFAAAFQWGYSVGLAFVLNKRL